MWAFETFATDEMGQWMRKYTTPSTATVTESLVRICRVKTVRWRMLLTTEKGAYVVLAFKKHETCLLWRDVKGNSSQVDLHKGISARQNKEKS